MPEASQPRVDVASVDERIAYILDCARRNRWSAAAVGLVALRQWHEAAAAGESWSEFVLKRLPSIEFADVERLLGRALYRGGILVCTGCGARALCQCGCGVAYAVEHPWAPSPAPKRSALDRAVAAILAAPERSNRALAAEIGMSHETLRRARARIKDATSDVAAHVSLNLGGSNARADADLQAERDRTRGPGVQART